MLGNFKHPIHDIRLILINNLIFYCKSLYLFFIISRGRIPHTLLVEFLRRMIPPLGLGARCPDTVAYKVRYQYWNIYLKSIIIYCLSKLEVMVKSFFQGETANFTPSYKVFICFTEGWKYLIIHDSILFLLPYLFHWNFIWFFDEKFVNDRTFCYFCQLQTRLVNMRFADWLDTRSGKYSIQRGLDTELL